MADQSVLLAALEQTAAHCCAGLVTNLAEADRYLRKSYREIDPAEELLEETEVLEEE